MTPLVPIALFGWPVVVLFMFNFMAPRHAVLIAMLGAWLFLPMAGYAFPVINITKMSVTCASVFAGALIFDSTRFSQLRWSVADLAMVIWILAPLPPSISSGYGAYEGVVTGLNHFVVWGMPYLIGRLYFGDAESLRNLAMGLFLAGLIYAPFVLFEAKMSPQLHTWVYGFHQHDFGQSKRLGGWRPTVFMQHGLAVAMFMTTAALCGIWLWTAGKVRTLNGVPMWFLACGLFAVAALCRSSYALMLMMAGAGALFASRAASTRLIWALMLMIAPAYAAARTVGGWDAQLLRDISALMEEDRGGSLGVRLASEDMLWKWLQGNVLLGRGRLDLMLAGQGEYGRFIPDGLWLIALGKYGMVGLISMLGTLLLPPTLYFSRHGTRILMSIDMTGATVLATVLVLYAMDSLLNAMENPIYLLAAGGLGVCRATVSKSSFHNDTWR